MNWKAQRPAIEIVTESIAAVAFGGAVGFAAWSLASLGTGLVALSAASVAGLVAAMAGRWAMRRAERAEPGWDERFIPVEFEEPPVLLLDEPVDPEILLLDTPIAVAPAPSRVIQLFIPPATAGESGQDSRLDDAALPAPGELVARIEDFLGGARSSGAAAGPGRPETADASAALHAALADIRRSLRQG